MAAAVFSDEELEGLRRFPEIGREELFRFFRLSPADLAFVDPGRGRGPADRLGLAVALCTLPWLGFVPDEVAAAPPVAVARLAEQLRVDPGVIRSYGRRAKTRTDHLRLVAQYLGWRQADSLGLKELDEFLLARAMEHDSPSLLFRLTRYGRYTRYGRFPRGRGELASQAVEFVARQVGVPAAELDFYHGHGVGDDVVQLAGDAQAFGVHGVAGLFFAGPFGAFGAVLDFGDEGAAVADGPAEEHCGGGPAGRADGGGVEVAQLRTRVLVGDRAAEHRHQGLRLVGGALPSDYYERARHSASRPSSRSKTSSTRAASAPRRPAAGAPPGIGSTAAVTAP